MMQPKEIAALYNYIRKTGGYSKSARTEIAGMLFEASKKKSFGDLKTQHDCCLLRIFSLEWMPDES